MSRKSNISSETNDGRLSTFGADVVVVDFGSLLSKVGFCGEDKPRRVFETVVGLPGEVRRPLDISLSLESCH